MASPPPPPLTRAELIAIRDGNRRNTDIRRLLHEVRRLRAVALQARQYIECVESGAQHTQLVRDCLVERLAAEPCVQEMDALREGMREEMKKAGRL